MATAFDSITALVKALEGGSTDVAPSKLVQGAALQVEDLSPLMINTSFEDQHLKLKKAIKSTPCKSTMPQFDRTLSYGIFGGTAQHEGHVGPEETDDIVRVTHAMAFYSHTRRVTLVSTMVDTVDDVKSDERAAKSAAKKIAGDIEFDLFRGKDDFTNNGVFDGHPAYIPSLPNMIGLGAQIRQSDLQRNSHDLMFAEYGSDESVVIQGGGSLNQDMIEDAHVRSMMNFGNAETLHVDPKCLSTYNKLAYGKERIILANSPQGSTGADLRKQFVSNGVVSVEASRFLSGKSQPAPARQDGPAAPSVVAAAITVSGVTTAFAIGEVYTYYATSGNERGESPKSAVSVLTMGAGDAGKAGRVTITHPGTGVFRFFNVYRSASGGSAASAKFIGRIVATVGGSTTVFWDLGNKIPGFVTGYLLDDESCEIRQLAPYSRLTLAVTELSQPQAHFEFLTLCVTQPRKSVIIENLRG